MSLHHLGDLAAAGQALRRLAKPGAAVIVREFDRVAMDHELTLRWWSDRRDQAQSDLTPDGHDLPRDFDEFVRVWRSMMEHHVLAWVDVRANLNDAGLATVDETECAYLFRWGLPESVRSDEELAAGSGEIRLVGRRWLGRRVD